MLALGEFTVGFLGQTADPIARTALTVNAVNGGNVEQRSYEYVRSRLRGCVVGAYVLVGALFFGPAVVRSIKTKTKEQSTYEE